MEGNATPPDNIDEVIKYLPTKEDATYDDAAIKVLAQFIFRMNYHIPGANRSDSELATTERLGILININDDTTGFKL
jgi:hypothetical protein